MKNRLDQEILRRGLAETRSQAENLIRLGIVQVNGKPVNKTGHFVSESDKIKVLLAENYVSRAGLKLAGANRKFNINFKNKIVLDVGSSTGGFSDYALQSGAKKIIAVDVGTNQMHPKLSGDKRVELHEKTDIRNFKSKIIPDIILIDVSFISVRQILSHLAQITNKNTQVLAMVKPQFEGGAGQTNRGIVKNERMRRQIMRDFEHWIKNLFKIVDKVDNEIAGGKGNIERFYLLKRISKNN